MGKEGTQLKQERLSFECNVTVGRELLALSQDVDGWEKRDCYSQLEDYLYRGERTRICLVYGLRRTGKTTMLRQAVADMAKEDQLKSVYIKVRRSDTMAMVNRDMKKLFDSGY